MSDRGVREDREINQGNSHDVVFVPYDVPPTWDEQSGAVSAFGQPTDLTGVAFEGRWKNSAGTVLLTLPAARWRTELRAVTLTLRSGAVVNLGLLQVVIGTLEPAETGTLSGEGGSYQVDGTHTGYRREFVYGAFTLIADVRP